MKLKKILAELVTFLDADVHYQRKEIKSMHKLLKQLKEKERKLCKQLSEADSEEEAQALQTKLDVVRAQRSKGVVHLRKLRQMPQH
jgi:predicted RNase H-like nuclease (RuvC/YqgF family)